MQILEDMAKITNKELIQSYILTTAKYDFNVYEKRVLYRLVELAQAQLSNEKLRGRISHDLFNFVDITMPIAGLLAGGEEDKNHARVKEALQSLQKKVFEYEDAEIWQSISIIAMPKIEKRSADVSFIIHPKVWDCILDFSKGFRKYELKVAMEFKSQYSMRFYELLSGQSNPITYTIDNLKAMFGVTEKYKRSTDFIKRVVVPAKKELDEKSPFSFVFDVIKHGKEFHSITFTPIYKPEMRDDDVEKKSLQRRIAPSFVLGHKEANALRRLGFTNKEISNNIELLREAASVLPDFIGTLADLIGKAMLADNPKGYIINALKGKLADLGN